VDSANSDRPEVIVNPMCPGKIHSCLEMSREANLVHRHGEDRPRS
jgi:hypothetical protein